jgi:hypothetical protein
MIVQGRHPDRNCAIATLHGRAIDLDYLLVLQNILFLAGWAGGYNWPVRWLRNGVDHLVDAGGSQGGPERARCPLKKASPTQVPAWSSRTRIFVAICHERIPRLQQRFSDSFVKARLQLVSPAARLAATGDGPG